jgi:biotin carboxyl carrier protein
MKFWSQLGTRELDLEVHVRGARLEVEIAPDPDAEEPAGAPPSPTLLHADVTPLPDGEVYSLLIDGRVHEVSVVEDADAIYVTLHGQRHRVLVRHPLEKTLREVRQAGPAAAGETILSPIPGLVVSIKVREGEAVGAGQAVAVVEAMKMQNELTAQVGGVVETVFVSERQTVEAGARLLRLVPLP